MTAIERCSERMRDFRASGREPPITRDDDVLSIRQGAADRLPCSPAHDDRVTRREGPKPLQILGHPPREFPLDTDDAVARNGCNQRQRGHRPCAHSALAHDGRDRIVDACRNVIIPRL
jgi:hypothetical protein